MPDVITQVIISDTREIRANIPLTPGGETLEHKFRTNFAPDRDIAMGTRVVTVFVLFEGNETGDFPILATLIRPDGTIAAGPLEMNNRPDPSLPTPPLPGQPLPGGSVPGVIFAVNTGAGPAGTGGIGGGTGDPPLPPEIDRLKYTITDEDPNGQWSVTLTNTGTQDGVFRILISHPGAQKTLKTSTVPISLVDRMLQTVRRLADPTFRIDRRARIEFSREFSDLIGIGPQRFGDGLGARDINMNSFEVNIAGTGGVVTLHAGVGFETVGPDEIPIPVFSDIDFKKLEFDLFVTLGSRFSSVASGDILVANPRPVLAQQRDLAGQLTHEMAGRVSLEFDLVADVETSTGIDTATLIALGGGDLDDIGDFIRQKFNAVVLGEDGRKKIPVVAEHFTDALMFLATGSRKQLFFDITSDGTNMIITHYSKPTVLDFLRPFAPGGVFGEINADPPTGSPGGVVVGPSGGSLGDGGVGGVGGGIGRFSNRNLFAALNPTRGTFSRGGAGSVFNPTLGTLSGDTLVRVVASGAFSRYGGTSAGTFSGNLTGISDLLAPGTGTVFDPRFGGAGEKSNRRIDHIVVLMMENRSFDHMLGYLSLEKSRGDIDGLTSPLDNTNPVPGSQTPQAIHQLDIANILVDPNHSHAAVLEQIANGAMSGFISSYLKRDPKPEDLKQVMGYYNDGFLNVFDRLAQEYKICDRWFCSHPGPTFPNRFISLMGSTPSLNNIEIGGNLAGAVKGDTIFDILTLSGVSWKYVESNIAFLRMFDRYRVDEENIIQFSEFEKIAPEGNLPAVTWIDPNFGELEFDSEANDDHPPANICKGQDLICRVYRALTANPAQWSKTLFIIDYDEHGGFYDHVPPHGLEADPSPPVPKIHDDGTDFYGPRVPAMLISPWVERRTVTSQIYDHTSVLKTILVNFIGPEAATQELLGKRVDVANNLLAELAETQRSDVPDCPDPLPECVTQTDSLAGRPIERDSFHLGMRLFPFGPKLKDLVGL